MHVPVPAMSFFQTDIRPLAALQRAGVCWARLTVLRGSARRNRCCWRFEAERLARRPAARKVRRGLRRMYAAAGEL